jgi:16S rRNA (adenine1518-N6/adenine1519-N6)-dimethyltransferase
MTLLQRAQQFLDEHPASVSKDQFFLVDEKLITQLIDAAGIADSDRVLEVGTGLGFLTEALAARAGSVLTIEIDRRFAPFLQHMPSNVELVWGDAYRLLNDKKFHSSHARPTKIVSSIPYSQAQNMMHNYTNWPWYQGDLVWVAPMSLAEKVSKEPIMGAYFSARVLQKIDKMAFLPQPNTASAIILFTRIPDPAKTKDFEIYFRRWLYNHEDMKVKNALREGIIHAAVNIFGKTVTKKQAQAMIESLGIPEDEFIKRTGNIRPEYYFELPGKIRALLVEAALAAATRAGKTQQKRKETST